jgi:hypothetical protein
MTFPGSHQPHWTTSTPRGWEQLPSKFAYEALQWRMNLHARAYNETGVMLHIDPLLLTFKKCLSFVHILGMIGDDLGHMNKHQG